EVEGDTRCLKRHAVEIDAHGECLPKTRKATSHSNVFPRWTIGTFRGFGKRARSAGAIFKGCAHFSLHRGVASYTFPEQALNHSEFAPWRRNEVLSFPTLRDDVPRIFHLGYLAAPDS